MFSDNDKFNEIEELSDSLKKIIYSSRYRSGSDLEKTKECLKKFHFVKALRFFLKSFKVDRNLNEVYSKTNVQINNNNFDMSNKKIVIYTCVTGGYDNINKPYYVAPNVDYVLFTDEDKISDDIWQVRKIPDRLKKYKGNLINRYIKLHPYEFFPDYDYSLYIDGNVKVVSDISTLFNAINPNFGVSMHKHCLRKDVFDEAKSCIKAKKGNKKNIKKQMYNYKQQGLPLNYGLLEATVIATEISNPSAVLLYNNWWDELVSSLSMRDQLALPYILWKNNISTDKIGTLGECVYTNKHFLIISH